MMILKVKALKKLVFQLLLLGLSVSSTRAETVAPDWEKWIKKNEEKLQQFCQNPRLKVKVHNNEYSHDNARLLYKLKHQYVDQFRKNELFKKKFCEIKVIELGKKSSKPNSLEIKDDKLTVFKGAGKLDIQTAIFNMAFPEDRKVQLILNSLSKNMTNVLIKECEDVNNLQMFIISYDSLFDPSGLVRLQKISNSLKECLNSPTINEDQRAVIADINYIIIKGLKNRPSSSQQVETK